MFPGNNEISCPAWNGDEAKITSQKFNFIRLYICKQFNNNDSARKKTRRDREYWPANPCTYQICRIQIIFLFTNKKKCLSNCQKFLDSKKYAHRYAYPCKTFKFITAKKKTEKKIHGIKFLRLSSAAIHHLSRNEFANFHSCCRIVRFICEFFSSFDEVIAFHIFFVFVFVLISFVSYEIGMIIWICVGKTWGKPTIANGFSKFYG